MIINKFTTLKLKDLFSKNKINLGQGFDYVLNNKGKIDKHPASKILFFIPITLVISCLVIIMTVIGLPAAMSMMRGGINSIFPAQEKLRGAPPEVFFTDVEANSKYFDSLAYLKKNGIIEGFKDKTFRPGDPLSRAELVFTLVKAKKTFPLALNYNNCFKDVHIDWFAPAVCLAKEKGWIKGFPDNTFRPADYLTKAEALKIIMSSFEVKEPVGPKSPAPLNVFVDVDPKAWYFNDVKLAQELNLLEENPSFELYKPDSLVTRGAAAQVIYRLLQQI